MAAELRSRKDRAEEGYVYILSSPDEPGSIKIGSTAHLPEPFRYETFGTQTPIPCKVEFAVHVPDRLAVEKNLALRLAQLRLADDRNRFATTPDTAISDLIQLVGYDYTNAQITGLIFRKQVDVLKRMETDFRSRHKSFSILNGELADMQKNIRRYQREVHDKTALIERQTAEIERLQGESAALAGKCRTARITAFAAGGIALLAVAVTAVSLTTFF